MKSTFNQFNHIQTLQTSFDRNAFTNTSSVVINLHALFQVLSWKSKLPLQTIMRLLQVLVPQVEKICIDK